MSVLAASDYAYGNTRLRSRKGELLTAADFERLLGKDAEGLVGALAETAYAPDVEAALTRPEGPSRVHAVVHHHLGRVLRELRSFYQGRARETVDLLLARFDVANLVTLLRAKAHGTVSPEEAVLALAPVGWPDEALAREILRQHELAGAVELIARWLPDAEQGRALWRAFAEYERTDDLAVLEHALVADHVARVTAAAADGADRSMLLDFLRREVDEQNVLVALRLRRAAERARAAADSRPQMLPGGAVARESLESAARLPDPDTAAEAIVELGRPEWRAPLERWAAAGDLVALAHDLETVRASDATRLFAAGDPLGIDVPLAYTVAKSIEARNLRVLAAGTTDGRDLDEVRADLVLPERT